MTDKYDLVLVGTGFASSFFLKKYLEKKGKDVRVLVLERGSFISSKERRESSMQEPYGLRKMTTFEGIPEDFYTTNDPLKPWTFDPNYGGSSNCWTGNTPRFMPNDFRMKTMYDVGQDWPISYDDLEPYYCETEAIMSIAGPEETPYPMSVPYPQPPHKMGTVDTLLHKEYGNLYNSQASARATRRVGKRGVCCSSSICHSCPVNAKFTIENSMAYLYEDPRVDLEFNCIVYNLIMDANVVKAVVYKKDGVEKKAYGEVVGLGANAIFNAQILKNAGDSNDFTGRYISEQKGILATFFLDGLSNLGSSSIVSANGFMIYDGEHRKEYAACLIENDNKPRVRAEKGKWRDLVRFRFVFEDLPQYENRVLAGEDEFTPHIQWLGSPAYVDKAFENLKANLSKTFSPLPIERIIFDLSWQATESHICSSTIMGTDSGNSVLDKNLIHHTYRNLFVLGSGAFTTVSPANPTLTLSALSLMSADKNF